MKKIFIYFSLFLVLTCLFSGCGSKETIVLEGNSLEEFGSSDKVVIIVLDGFASRYLDYLDQDSNLYNLLEYSTYNLDAKTIYPSHTCNAHASLMTGLYPDRHGVIGNVYYDQADYISQKNIHAERIEAKTLFEIAKENSRKTAIVSGKKNMLTLFKNGCDLQTTMIEHPDYIKKAPSSKDSQNNKEYFKYNLKTTTWVFNALQAVLSKDSPDVTLVNIHSADYIGHRFGPDSKEVEKIVKLIDKNIGELFSFMKKSKMLEDTSVMILADHGMSSVSKAIPLNVLLANNFNKAAGIVDGRNAYVWLNGENEAEVVSFLQKQNGVKKITSKGSIQAKDLKVDCERCPDLILDSKPGYLFIPEALLGKYQGMHGSTEDTDLSIPIICFGKGIPQKKQMKEAKIIDLVPIASQLMGFEGCEFDGRIPELVEAKEINYFTR